MVLENMLKDTQLLPFDMSQKLGQFYRPQAQPLLEGLTDITESCFLRNNT